MGIIPAGALFTITAGCYSDYSVDGVFRALRDINTDSLKEEWLAIHPEQRERYAFSQSEFLGWVVRQGLLEPVECWEWHIEDDSTADEMSLEKFDIAELYAKQI